MAHKKYKQGYIADVSDERLKELITLGNKEIAIARTEMPALMGINRDYIESKPLSGARILGCLHMTIQTAVLIETLVALGAEVRWSSCNQYSTQDHAAAAIADQNIPVFAWKGETEKEYEWCVEQTIFDNGKPWTANMVLDDGGDLTALLHKKYPQILEGIHGITEETTTGVKQLEKFLKEGILKTPAINVNDSVTKSKCDNKYGCRHSLNDALKRATDSLLSGKKALVIGYGDVGKGSAQSLAQESMIVRISEIDPICGMQACMDGFEVVSPFINGDPDQGINTALLAQTDVLITTTGNINVCTFEMLKVLKKGAIVANIGHFDNEIDVASMRSSWRWSNVEPLVDQIYRSQDESDWIILLSEGRLVNLGNAMGHPSRIMDGSFANQVLAQCNLFSKKFADNPEPKLITVKVLSKQLDENVARYMVGGFGGTITSLTDEQCEYLQLNKQGPFKGNAYRY